MATCLKRTSKLCDLSLIRASAEVNLRDLICPICRGILIEPVTLPCTHNLCLRCLKGTFEHNSLSCPLCRVRVGSWLRTATKSETLVNGALWKLIRSRFPKEVEGKHNGDDGDIELDSDFAPKKIILSAAGEIRREYEVQLRAAEEEMRRECETERLANEALIRKIHEEEEQEKLSQLASDQLLAKSLAKKQLLRKDKRSTKHRVDNKTNNRRHEAETTDEHDNPDENSSDDDRGNFRAETTSEKNLTMQNNVETSGVTMKVRNEKNSTNKTSSFQSSKETLNCQKFNSSHDVVTRTLKHRDVGKSTNVSNFSAEPSCSGTQIYGSRSKEELHVPTDILCSKKKTLGVEVCLTKSENDERIGSAESAASHDSINQEIHHFKPIRPIARTSLKTLHDGRPIDPKLIRVIPIVKRVSNAVPKPPSPTHFKRILGCSWSAFRGKARENLEQRKTSTERNEKNSAGEQSMSKSSKPQPSETARRLDLAPEVTFDANKNYAKSINRILNGTRVSKKLIMEEEPPRTSRARKVPARNMEATRRSKKSKRQNSWEGRDGSDVEDEEEDSSEICSPENLDVDKRKSTKNDDTIENIAERIKRRRIDEIADKSAIVDYRSSVKRRTRRNSNIVVKSCESSKRATKRRRVRGAESATSGTADSSTNRSIDEVTTNGDGKNANEGRNETSATGNNGEISRSSLNDFPSDNDLRDAADNKSDIDRRIFAEQTRMERLIMQEKKDFELAMRLQAQFDDMERISGRTRGSRRAMENFERFADLKIDRSGENNVDRGNPSRDCRNGKQRRRPQKNAIK